MPSLGRQPAGARGFRAILGDQMIVFRIRRIGGKHYAAGRSSS